MNQTIWALKGIAGEFEGNTLPLLESVMTIGRTSQNHIYIADPNVSRLHATLFIDKEGVRIQDEKSHNGLLINERKLGQGASIRLKHGDRIQIGPHGFVIEQIEKNASEPQAKKTKISFSWPTKLKTLAKSISKRSGETGNPNKLPKIQWNRRTVMYSGLALFLLFMMMTTLPPKNTSPKKQVEPEIEIEATDPIPSGKAIDDSELGSLKTQARAAMQFQDYLAATELYEKIVHIQPEDEFNKTQYEYAKKQLKSLIERHLENAKREYEKLNYERAIIEWKQVQALTVRANPEIYKQTGEKIQNTQKEIQRQK